MPWLRSSLVTANSLSKLRKLRMLARAVIWCTTTSGCAAPTASSTAWRSRPSTMAGVAPALFSWAALAGERVVPVTSWPAATRLGMRYWPMTPVAPATKTRMM